MSSWQQRDEEEQEEEEEEAQEYDPYQTGKDCLIMLVDASPAMHAPNASGQTPFRQVLETAIGLMETKVIVNEQDLVAILFYGTRANSNTQRFEHIYAYHDLDQPSADRISKLTAMAKDPAIFNRDIGSSPAFNFFEALWVCQSMFSMRAKKFDSRRVFILTNNDNPNAGSPELQRNAVVRANDLRDAGTVLHLFALKRDFNFSLFFQDRIIKADEDDGGSNLSHTTDQLDELKSLVRQKEFRRRTAFRCPLILGQDFEIGVSGYNLYTETKPASAVHLLRATNQEVKPLTTFHCATTLQQLSNAEMDSAFTYGGQKVVFTKEEMSKIKTLGEPGLRLIGFKPVGEVLRKPYYNLKHSSFIFPDEKGYTGSTIFFVQFLLRVKALGKAVICSFIPRRNASPRLVALIPQVEEYDESGNLARPSGFHLLHLPFSDDIRKPPAPSYDFIEREPKIKESMAIMSALIDKLTIKNFSLENYENPSLQKHYANLQTVALKKEHADDVPDHTQPNLQMIQLRAGALIADLKASLPEPDEETASAGSKRRAPDAAAASKRARPDVDPAAVREAFEAGELGRLTVPVLQDFLKGVGVKPRTRKADVVAQVTEHFSK